MKLCGKFSWVWSTFNLSKCTMVHLVSFLHDLNNIWLSAGDIPLKFLWSFTWGWRNYHLVKVWWVVLVLKSLHCWVLLARDAALLLLCYLWLETNCRSRLPFKELFVHRIIVSIRSINWIHGVESVLDLFILLSTHIIRVWNLLIWSSLSWTQFQIEVDAGAELVYIYYWCIFVWLVYICCVSNETIIAGTTTMSCTHCCSELAKLCITKLAWILLLTSV